MALSNEQLALLKYGYRKLNGKSAEMYDFQDWDGDTEPWGEALMALYLTLHGSNKSEDIKIGRKNYKPETLLPSVWKLCTQVLEECDQDIQTEAEAPFARKYEEGKLEGVDPTMPDSVILAINQIFNVACHLMNVKFPK